MATGTILPASIVINSPFLLNKKIKQLQSEHKELEESINERLESLIMQINLPNIIHPSTPSPLNTSLIASILSDHTEMHSSWSNQLLKNQIHIQQEGEIKEIIRSYEKRIMDLRTMLVSKQAEIVYETFQLRRDNIPKRENLQFFNNQTFEKLSIRKSLEELKKVKVEVDALEHTIKKKTALGIKKKQPCDEISLLSCSTSATDKIQADKLESLALKKSNSGEKKDKFLIKINQLLEEEFIKEGRLQEELKLQKMQWMNATQNHKKLCQKYSSLVRQRLKVNAKTSEVHNILQELENEEKQDRINTLFNKKDLNTVKNSPLKHEKRRQNLKSKRKHGTKQN